MVLEEHGTLHYVSISNKKRIFFYHTKTQCHKTLGFFLHKKYLSIDIKKQLPVILIKALMLIFDFYKKSKTYNMEIVLQIHSYWAYLTLGLMLMAVVNFSLAFFGKRDYFSKDLRLALFTLIVMHIQLLIGLAWYFMSPAYKHLKELAWEPP